MHNYWRVNNKRRQPFCFGGVTQRQPKYRNQILFFILLRLCSLRMTVCDSQVMWKRDSDLKNKLIVRDVKHVGLICDVISYDEAKLRQRKMLTSVKKN